MDLNLYVRAKIGKKSARTDRPILYYTGKRDKPSLFRRRFVLFPGRRCAYICNMDLYAAIKQMRQFSDQKVPFSFSFMSCATSTQSSQGIVDVRHARLRPRPQASDNRFTELLEEYVDLDTGEARQFYRPLLMIFNGQKVVLQ